MKRLRTGSSASFLGSERGTAVTEFVVVLPLLLIILFGVTGIGQALLYHQIITKGIRDGVRYLTRVPLTEPYLTNAKTIALTGSPGGSTAFSFWNDPSSIDISTSTVDHGGAFRDPGPITIVQMTATVPVDFPILTFWLLGLGPTVTFTVTDEARYIGE
jgi:Flp pilus assembly protein TadG